MRYYPDTVVVGRDTDNNLLVEELGAVPYNLYIQIDFWSRLQSDMDMMTRKWLGYNPEKHFNLPVKDVSGNERNSFSILSDDLRRSDFTTGKDRTFRSTLTYKIWVEIDEKVQIETPMVTEIIPVEPKKLN